MMSPLPCRLFSSFLQKKSHRGLMHSLFTSTALFTVAMAMNIAAVDAAQPAAQRYVAQDLGWTLRLPTEEIVTYQGVANFDSAGLGPSTMLYPAPNIAGALVSLITHGVIVESARNAQKTRVQEAADQVLAPFKSILSNFKYRDLMQQALEKTTTGGNRRVSEPSEIPEAGLRVESLPVFAMTPDQSAIVLDNSVAIFAPRMPSSPAYKNVIRVISRSETSTDLVAYWNNGEGAALKSESARLLAESLDLAFSDLGGAFDKARPQRTVRYTEGRSEKMERGEILGEYCDRVVLRNLRGSLMSVIVKLGTDKVSVACEKESTNQPPSSDKTPKPSDSSSCNDGPC